MIKPYIFLGIPLLLSALLTAGCSLNTHQAEKQTPPTNETPEKVKPLDTAKNVVDKNTKIAAEITATETKIAALESEIAQTAPGAERAKLVKRKSRLEEQVKTLRERQIGNAKAYKNAKQREVTEKASGTSSTTL